MQVSIAYGLGATRRASERARRKQASARAGSLARAPCVRTADAARKRRLVGRPWRDDTHLLHVIYQSTR